MAVSVYEFVGGETFFRRLVDEFYLGVADDPVLRPMYPEDDLGPASDRLALFLMQYFGGPTTYSDERGHPRLRMRHAPFPIDSDARRRWLTAMNAALDRLGPEEPAMSMMRGYFENAAEAMRNIVDEGAEPAEGDGRPHA